MKAQPIHPRDLEERLTRAAKDLERYDTVLEAIIEELDADGTDLALEDPSSWRRPDDDSERRSPRSLAEQFRFEVEGIRTLDRAPEAALARRIELARRRLERALERHELAAEDLEDSVSLVSETAGEQARLECTLPKEVCRRWFELHALRTEMVERNLYLVLINVERYAHTRVSRMDLIQEGSAALFRAVDGFDWRRGLLFRTYAVHWLNQAFRSFLYNFGNTVRVPVYLQKAMKHVHDAKVRLGNPDASPEAISEETGIAVHMVEAALEASRGTHSIDAGSSSDDDAITIREVLGVEEADPYDPRMEEITLHDGIGMALQRLGDREQLVIKKRFGIDGEREHTLAEIARELGVSLERVRQIQVRAISKMDTPQIRKAIDPFLIQ